jgi:RNA polymerase sigma-70 factor (ECF subfamily)
LPEPVPDALLDRREGAAYAMLVAMERLTPTQRAVWLLREVFDYDVSETAEALTLSVSNVKVTLMRAKRILGELPEQQDSSDAGELFSRFLHFLTTGDAAGAVALLTEDVVLLNDGGGRYEAAGVPVTGVDRVVKALLGVSRLGAPPEEFGVQTLNGQPMLWVRRTPSRPREAPEYLFGVTVRKGKISEIYTVLAAEKLRSARSGDPP